MAQCTGVYTVDHFTRIAMLEEENLILRHKLAEFEDKIEQGTLIELPCKVGDTVYWLIANKYIIDCVVSLTNISVGKKTHFTVWAKQKCEGVENDFSSDDLGEEWFLTREEAEKRQKELQE